MPLNSTNDSAPGRGTPSRSGFIDRPWQLLAFLFFVAGAAGIPAIWASRALSTRAKIVLTVVVSLYTLAVLALLVWALIFLYEIGTSSPLL